MLKYLNKLGKVGIDISIYETIAVSVAESFKEKVILSNSKGKPVKISGAPNEKYSCVRAEENKDRSSVDIEVFLILKFGTSISWFTKEFAFRLRNEAEMMTDMVIDSIVINITGIKSKNIARRELRIEC